MKNGNAETKEDRAVVLSHLRATWELFPQLRLCQLISRAMGPCGPIDIFYATDESLIKGLQEASIKRP